MLSSLTSLLADNPAQWYTGMAVVDLDGDGECECVVAANGGRNLVLKWGGDAFFDVGIAPLTDESAPSMGIAAGDADGDGREELYIGNGEAVPDRLFAWRRGGWADLLSGSQERNQSSQSVLAFDRFGMGRYGFMVAHEGGPFRYVEVMGQDRVEDVAPLIGLARIAGGRSLVAGPLLDGGLQIYAGNEGIANMLFLVGDNGRFQERAAEHGLADTTGAARGLALIDANFDGRLDLVGGNQRGAQRLFVQGAQAVFQDVALEGARNVRGVIVADFDNDGFEEIFLHGHGEPNLLYAWRNHDWRLVDCGDAVEPQGYGVGAVAGDWNGDGMLELMLGHGETVAQPLSLYAVKPNGNHWLRVAPLTATGAPARGAVVRLHCGRIMTRVIDCGSGYLSQNEPVAHFGLGTASSVEWLEVIWPDGARVQMRGPEIEKTMRVAYPNQTL